MTRHPLLGRFLRWDTEDGEAFTVSRFDEDLGNGFFLAKRLCPRHGEDLGVSHIVSLGYLTDRDGVEIYGSFEELVAAWPEDDGDAVEPDTRHVH
jgi:hypothetical protein